MQRLIIESYVLQMLTLLAMLTVGKLTTDAGYWLTVAAIIIGAVIGVAWVMRDARRKPTD